MTSNLRESFAQTMVKIGSKDENLMVMVGDISHGILQPFAQKFPNRYYNIGICEPSIINMAAGLSEVGLIPVVHTIAPFLIERSYDGEILETVAEVTPTTASNYRYRDVTVLPGMISYRITSFNADGSSSQSPVEILRLTRRR